MVDAKAISASMAYADALNRAKDIGPGASGGEVDALKSGQQDFSSMLEDVAKSAIEGTKNGDDAGIRAAAGQIDMIDVVTAVTNAEITLQTVVAIRDKVVESYEKILQMPI
jgi:flagellar hook-basal body complex protein FliE